MAKRKSIIETIYNTIVVDGAVKTPTQLAKLARTSEPTVRSTISRIRRLGFAIYANVKVDKKGTEVVTYRHGEPTTYMKRVGSTMTR